MSVRLSGSTSGYVQLSAPATAGNNTLVLPTGNGTAGQLVGTSGAGQLTFVDKANFSGAVSFSVATTISYTGISSTARRFRMVGIGLSNGGAAGAFFGVRVGNSGGFLATGYSGGTARLGTSGTTATSAETTYLRISENVPGAADTYTYILDWVLADSVANLWTVTGQSFTNVASAWANIIGYVTVSGLDRVQFLSANGNFDAGTLYVTWD